LNDRIFLCHAEDHDTLASGESLAISGHDRVFILARFKLDLRNLVSRNEPLNGRDKAVVYGPKQCGRRNRLSEMVVQKVAEPA
jgi:hypothetical protein